jgi:exopolyphosphatase/guanosine-5'-triphosphate,3'-diphosphate pyrophosphatase
LQVFAPLANRLGIWQLKWELEDLSFRFLEPSTYREVAAMLDGVRQSWGVRPPGRMHLLGTSGTVTTVAGIHLGLARYDRTRVDGAWLHAQDISCVVDRLMGMSFEERVSNPCIGAQRADLVLAGCAIMEAIRETFPTDRLRVADRGLREGMLVQLMRADGAWRRHRVDCAREPQA